MVRGRARPQRVLGTVLFTDIVGSTQRAAELGDRAWWRDTSSFHEQFESSVALGPDFANGSLVGATAEQLAAWGYDPVPLPNMDSRIEAGVPLVGQAQFQCWAGLDQYLMQDVVALVPYVFDKLPVIVGPRVVEYSFDQAWAAPAWDQIAVKS